MLNIFRLVAIVEGLSLLVLFFIAMPLKYYYGMPEVVSVVGLIHGILFLIFIAFSSVLSQKKGWSDKFHFLVIVSSMIPFATFYMDRKLKAQV